MKTKNITIKLSSNKIPCTKCGALLQPYWLKEGICHGCRNPHLVVVNLAAPKYARLSEIDIIKVCTYCGNKPEGRMCYCGEHNAYFEEHYYSFEQDLFANFATGELVENFGRETAVHEKL